MKKLYQMPEMSILHTAETDVIATSLEDLGVGYSSRTINFQDYT